MFTASFQILSSVNVNECHDNFFFVFVFINADLLSATVVALAEQNMLSAEIEADYMWGLIHPSFLVGDARFHLTTFSSAVEQLKNLRKLTESRTSLHRGSIVSN
jgi:hypothetical protein